MGDGMRRHLVTLERERQNLEESIRLCQLLKEREMPLSELDAQAVLQEMEQLEQAGASFQDTGRQDIRVRYVAPVVAAAVMVALMTAVIGVFLWAILSSPENAPPWWLMVIFLAVPLGVIGGVLLALFQRIKEIGKGEIDDAKQY